MNSVLNIPERDILKSVRDLLKLEGFFIIRNQAGFGTHKGLSDITAVKNGMTLWIETKTKKGHLSEFQEKFKEDVESHGGFYLIIRDVEDLITWLENHKLNSLSRMF